MNRKNLYIPLIIILLSVLIVFEILKPKPIDWSYNFQANSKKPNGCYIYFQLLNKLLTGHSIVENETNLYDFLHNREIARGSMFAFITDNFDADSVEMSLLLNKVKRGNTLFISALYFNNYLQDTLNFEIAGFGFADMNKKVKFALNNPLLAKKEGYPYKSMMDGYFQKIDTANTSILGTNTDGKANFIAFKFGRGHILLHLSPTVFSNYQLLYGNKDYPMALTAYFQSPTIYWDDYMKPGNLFRNGSPSQLRYILSNESLKMAYILALITLVLLIFFDSKRKQRVIPVMHPPVNSSLEFVDIIASLYMSSGDYKYVAARKFTFLSEYIRSHFYMSVSEADASFHRKLSEKSGVKIELVKSIFEQNRIILAKTGISSNEMMEFIKRIDEFYDQCNLKHKPIRQAF